MVCRLDSASGIDHHVLGFQISIDDVPISLATNGHHVFFFGWNPIFLHLYTPALSYQTKLVVQFVSTISVQKHKPRLHHGSCREEPPRRGSRNRHRNMLQHGPTLQTPPGIFQLFNKPCCDELVSILVKGYQVYRCNHDPNEIRCNS